jgi:hypothetical protein
MLYSFQFLPSYTHTFLLTFCLFLFETSLKEQEEEYPLFINVKSLYRYQVMWDKINNVSIYATCVLTNRLFNMNKVKTKKDEERK